MNTIHHGSAPDVLKTFEPESVDLVVTSPPYFNLRDYQIDGQVWDGDPQCEHDFSIQHTRKQSGGTGKTDVGNYSDDRLHYTSITNTCSRCGAWKGSLGMEPTPQLYIRHLIQVFAECKRVLKKTGAIWVNLGDSYNGEKSLIGIPERFVIAMTDDLGLIRRNTVIFHKPNCMPSSIKSRFTVDFDYFYFFTKSQKYFFETQYEPFSESMMKEIQKAYTGRGTKDYQDNGVQNPSDVKRRIIERYQKTKFGGGKYPGREGGRPYSGNGYTPNLMQGRIKRAVWKIKTQPFPEAHFAVFPEALVETPIRACCPENGVILDPFLGSGTVAVVARKQRKNWVGVELSKEYIDIATRRLKNTAINEKLILPQ